MYLKQHSKWLNYLQPVYLKADMFSTEHGQSTQGEPPEKCKKKKKKEETKDEIAHRSGCQMDSWLAQTEMDH